MIELFRCSISEDGKTAFIEGDLGIVSNISRILSESGVVTCLNFDHEVTRGLFMELATTVARAQVGNLFEALHDALEDAQVVNMPVPPSGQN